MSDQDLTAKVKEKAQNDKLACKVALSLAEELGVSAKQIGDAANRVNIKIVACQLGCFQ